MDADNLKQVQIIGAVVLVLVGGLLVLGAPSITGHQSLDLVMEELDITIDGSRNYLLSTKSADPFVLTSLRLSGEVVGEGRAEVYLVSGEQELLIYRNAGETEQAMDMITGFFVKEAEVKDDKGTVVSLVLQPLDPIQLPKLAELPATQYPKSGPFRQECLDTCFITMFMGPESEYELSFRMDKGTRIELSEILYTVETED